MITIGIDPGKHGAIAITGGARPVVSRMILAGKVIDWRAMAELVLDAVTERIDAAHEVAHWSADGTVDLALEVDGWIEKAHAMPGERMVKNRRGVLVKRRQGVSSAFEFGRSYEGWFGVFGAYGIPLRIVTSQAWKRVILAGTAKDKDAAIAHCRRAWPNVSLLATDRSRVAHDGIADALCIAEYGARITGHTEE